MRTEAEIRKARADIYNVAITIAQTPEQQHLSEMPLIFCMLLDWVLGERELDKLEGGIRLFQQFEDDKKKLALFS